MREFALWDLLKLSARPSSGSGTKHAELSGCLREAIRTGHYGVGDKLPTEAEFVAGTPYSLGTVQRAIRTLVEEGLVERKPKLGTFVSRRRRKIDSPWHFRFLDADRRTILPVYPTVVARVSNRQRGPWNDFLAGDLLRIDRLVNVNDEFNAFSRFFIDATRFPVFAQVAEDTLHGENFRALLNTQLAEPIDRICHRIAFSRPAPGVAKQIGVPADRPCTVVEIAAAARNGDFLYYQELTVPVSDRRLELADPTSVHHPL